MRYVLGLFLLTLTAPVLASNPGQPMDCSDWVFLVPGLSCTTMEPFDCDKEICRGDGVPTRQADNEGFVLFVRTVEPGTLSCPGVSGTNPLWRTELVRSNGTTQEVLGYIERRCGAFAEIDGAISANIGWTQVPVGLDGVLVFNSATGRVWMPMRSGCNRAGSPSTCAAYGGQFSGLWLAAIDGLASTFDILQTFTPTADSFSFRVPYMPEGMQFASFFDTYTGDLDTVGNWSQLQPLQCGYPTTAPAAGDFMTVADTLPTPAPGTGRYYLTVANYMGERRFGRKNIGGVLSGRDPSALPVCP